MWLHRWKILLEGNRQGPVRTRISFIPPVKGTGCGSQNGCVLVLTCDHRKTRSLSGNYWLTDVTGSDLPPLLALIILWTGVELGVMVRLWTERASIIPALFLYWLCSNGDPLTCIYRSVAFLRRLEFNTRTFLRGSGFSGELCSLEVLAIA